MKIQVKICLGCIYVGLMFCLVVLWRQVDAQKMVMEERQLLVKEYDELEAEVAVLEKSVSVAEAELQVAKEQLQGLENEVESTKNYQQKLQKLLDENADLYHTDLDVIVVHYDAERFRETEKEQNIVGEVAGTALQSILGSFFGGGVKESVQSNVNHVYSNRVDFNQDAIRWLQASMYEVSSAASTFDGCYEQYRKMSETTDAEQWIAENALLEQAGEHWENELLVEEKQNLLEAMAKYRFHLQVFYDLYAGILTDAEYLGELQQQLALMDTLLTKYDSGQELGYDAITKAELLQTIMKEYSYLIDGMIDGKVEDPALLAIGAEATDWEKKHKAIYNAAGLKLYLWYQNDFSAYFDKEGKPLMISSASGQTIYFYKGEVLSHTFADEESMQSFVEHVKQEYKEFETKFELH